MCSSISFFPCPILLPIQRNNITHFWKEKLRFLLSHPGGFFPRTHRGRNEMRPSVAGTRNADSLSLVSKPIFRAGSSLDPDYQRAEGALSGEELTTIRRHLHQYPELIGREIGTTDYVGRYLSDHGIPCRPGPGGKVLCLPVCFGPFLRCRQPRKFSRLLFPFCSGPSSDVAGGGRPRDWRQKGPCCFWLVFGLAQLLVRAPV